MRRSVSSNPLKVSVVLLALLAGCGAKDELPPNILLISIDSLRADHLGCYGYERPTSPAIDALAEEGVVFEEAISQAPWTLPSHASLLTSLYGRTHQTNDISRQLPHGIPTLSGTLSEAGYETSAVVSGTFMQTRFGLNSGFAHYDDDIAQFDHRRSHEAVTSPEIQRKAEALLSGAQEPFMLFLHYWDVHYDYAPPPPYDTKFDPDYTGKVSSKGFLKNKRIEAGMPAADLDHVVALYDGEIAWVDEHIGRLLATLEATGLDERTIVILTADHGDEFFEHGGKGHSHSLYRELVNVPLIVRGPGVTAGGRVSTPVELIDIMPTVLELTGVRAPDGLQGRRLGAALSGGGLPAQPVFSETTRARVKKPDPWRESWSVQHDAMKLIRHGKGPSGEPARATELYDLAADAKELSSLGPSDARGGQLEAALERWLARTPLGPGALNRGVDAGTIKQLRAHGYLGDEDEDDED